MINYKILKDYGKIFSKVIFYSCPISIIYFLFHIYIKGYLNDVNKSLMNTMKSSIPKIFFTIQTAVFKNGIILITYLLISLLFMSIVITILGSVLNNRNKYIHIDISLFLKRIINSIITFVITALTIFISVISIISSFTSSQLAVPGLIIFAEYSIPMLTGLEFLQISYFSMKYPIFGDSKDYRWSYIFKQSNVYINIHKTHPIIFLIIIALIIVVSIIAVFHMCHEFYYLINPLTGF